MISVQVEYIAVSLDFGAEGVYCLHFLCHQEICDLICF